MNWLVAKFVGQASVWVVAVFRGLFNARLGPVLPLGFRSRFGPAARRGRVKQLLQIKIIVVTTTSAARRCAEILGRLAARLGRLLADELLRTRLVIFLARAVPAPATIASTATARLFMLVASAT